MSQDFLEYVSECFSKLVYDYGCNIGREVNNGEGYLIEYRSDLFGMKIEKYRREFYATVYKVRDSDMEIDLFNLVDFLKEHSSRVPQANYFRGEKNTEESYRKQLKHISTTLYAYFSEISGFFASEDYLSKAIDLRKFVLHKYPELFKRK